MPLGHVGVAIVDDDDNMHVLARDLLERAHGFRWVGSFYSGEAALAGIPHSGAHVVLMDIKMPGMSGIECARRLKALHPLLAIVMITGLDDQRTINLARESGADAFLAKPFTAGQFLATLSFSAPYPKAEASEQHQGSKDAAQVGPRGRALTNRENELLHLLSEGLQYKEISDRWDVSVSAVHGMQHRVFQKLGVGNAREAIRKWQMMTGDSDQAF